MQTLSTAAHVKPSLLGGQLGGLLPALYAQTAVDASLIRTVDLGPFKHKIDDGLELRKVLFLDLSGHLRPETVMLSLSAKRCLVSARHALLHACAFRPLYGMYDTPRKRVFARFACQAKSIMHLLPSIAHSRLFRAKYPCSATALSDHAIGCMPAMTVTSHMPHRRRSSAWTCCLEECPHSIQFDAFIEHLASGLAVRARVPTSVRC